MAFILYFHGTVKYDGRANSHLGPGNFLLTYKRDGSLTIHGGTLCTPRNYMSPGCTIKHVGNSLIFERKKEIITVDIQKIINHFHPVDWCESEVIISRTEADLVNKLVENWVDYFGFECASIEREVESGVGKIDILGIDMFGIKHVVEAKRNKATITNCGQLRKYVEALGSDAIGYLAAPDISDKALQYLMNFGFKFIRVEF